MNIRKDAEELLRASLQAAMELPRTCVTESLGILPQTEGKLLLVAVGKAAWEMAQAAYEVFGDRIDGGIVITKHGHSRGPIGPLTIREAGHPVPDEHTYAATREALALTEGLTEQDTVLFCLSGGGSALFEQPLLPEEELADVTRQLLACGADIVEINTLRKRFSAVKGGRFASHCAPAKVFGVLLSDVLGDRADMIASGPACPDASTCEQALAIAEKYRLSLSPEAHALLREETPKELPHAETRVAGSVRQLCESAMEACRALGYEPHLLTDRLCCEAREAGSFFASIAKTHSGNRRKLAFLAGGETVVHLTGKGLGGRNQELALAAAMGMDGLPPENALLFSLGSDGTDGPTDAAGGIVDGSTASRMRASGVSPADALANNDAYHALRAADALLLTGPTGTNVNDLTVLLVE
ncbi:MAG: glycerate kinase [Oscillospiraceae bacterium]|nr:glycerate kinase [Oscillospiraceae bacterium]